MALRMKITYLDGRVEDVRTTPRLQIMTERHFKGITEKNALQASYFLAWMTLKSRGKEDAEFEPWLDKIDEVEQIQDEEDESSDPTRLGLSPDSSSD